MQFAVTGDVESPVQLLPSGDWNIGEVRDDVPGTMTATLISKVHKDFKITEVKSGSEHVMTEIKPLGKERITELQALSGYAIA